MSKWSLMGIMHTVFLSILIVNILSALATQPGGIRETNLDDPDIRNLESYSRQELLTSSGGKNKELGKLIKATVQIVSGTRTTLYFDGKDAESPSCSVAIWRQPWLKKQVIVDSTCGHDIKKRSPETRLDLFNKFMETYNKRYKNSAEYKKRYHAFKNNLKKIEMLNDNEQGTAKYGVNEFADLTEKEFKTFLGLKKPKTPVVLPAATIPNITLPEEYDWRNYNVVTPVKNQGSCGSCWTFSVTGNIEGQWAIRTGNLLSLSEQEIVDCDAADDGCSGGYMTTAYSSITKMGGLESESDYPYEGRDGKCRINNSEIEVQIQGGVNITSDEDGMAQWLTRNGPISVGLNANAMQFYMGGVSHPYKFLCNPADLDHGVLVVGYGVYTSKVLKRTLPYWIVKNSWGKRWGELGYYRLYRGDGSCGINLMASSAVL